MSGDDALFSATKSNHSPIILNSNIELGRKSRPFRLEVTWSRDEIRISWDVSVNGSAAFQLLKKLDKLKGKFIGSGTKSALGGDNLKYKNCFSF